MYFSSEVKDYLRERKRLQMKSAICKESNKIYYLPRINCLFWQWKRCPLKGSVFPTENVVFFSRKMLLYSHERCIFFEGKCCVFSKEKCVQFERLYNSMFWETLFSFLFSSLEQEKNGIYPNSYPFLITFCFDDGVISPGIV